MYVYSPITVNEAAEILNARQGTIMSIVLFTHNHLKYKYRQSMFGVELWRQGASQSLFRTSIFWGISQSITAARHHIYQLILDSAVQVNSWKEDLKVKI